MLQVPGRRTRLWLLAALTAVALLVTGGLAREAWQATERHRASAEAALRDHASFAALTFRQVIISRIWLASDAIFRGVDRGRHEAGTPFPPVGVLREAAERYARCGDCGPPIRPSYFFRVLVADSSMTLIGGFVPAHRRDHLVREAIQLPLRRQWTDWDYASFVDTLGPVPELVLLTERRDESGRPLAIYGYAMGLEEVATAFLRPPLDALPLLPVPPRSQLTNDSLLSVSLLHPGGGVALELSPKRLPDTYSARIHGSRFLGGWTLRVAVDPGTAPALLVGGLPQGRTPLLAGLVGLALLLVLSTIAVAWRALELAHLQSGFVASVSHELRTPLAQILLFGESLTLGTMRTRRDVRVAGRIVVGEARRLLRLVDNVLMFGRRDNQTPPEQSESLAPLVRDVIAGFTPVAGAAESTLATVRLEDVAAPADGGAIRQVLLNLLDNAVKYGPRGQTVSLGLALVDGRARFWVEDEGPGIPPAERARVWRPFVRLERDVDRQAAGSGIGLSLVREIVMRHRGSARIESTPAGGTRVVVELPNAHPLAEEVTCAS